MYGEDFHLEADYEDRFTEPDLDSAASSAVTEPSEQEEYDEDDDDPTEGAHSVSY